MIKYGILGEVTAWDGDREEVPLGRGSQLKLLLACLVMAKGKTVSESTLEEATGSTRAIKAVVSELRKVLALPDGALQAAGNRAYRLVLNPEQADVLRFLNVLGDASQTRGDDRIRLLRAALAEWGPDAKGLNGEPLLGLPGTWAETSRRGLQNKRRGAILECVKHDLDSGKHQEVMRECYELADGEALGHDDFVEVWITATYLSGQRNAALDIFRRADEYARNHSFKGASKKLNELVEMIKDNDPRLGSPDHRSPILPTTVADAPNADTDQAPAQGSPGPGNSEPSITFSVSGNARVGSQVARNDGHITVHMGARTKPATGDAGDSDPAAGDGEETD